MYLLIFVVCATRYCISITNIYRPCRACSVVTTLNPGFYVSGFVCSFKLQGKKQEAYMFKAKGCRTVQVVFTSPALRPMACSTDIAPDFTADCSSPQLPTCMVSTLSPPPTWRQYDVNLAIWYGNGNFTTAVTSYLYPTNIYLVLRLILSSTRLETRLTNMVNTTSGSHLSGKNRSHWGIMPYSDNNKVTMLIRQPRSQ